MNVNFQTAEKGGKSATVEWYTPPEFIQALGKFDLDPATCEAAIKLNNSASKYYTKEDNGLIKGWFGRVWLNPPYQNPDIKLFMQKMADHNNGIALVFNRCDSYWFQEHVLGRADSIFFLQSRIRFLRPDGTRGDSPGAGSVLIAYGEHNTEALANSGFKGKLMKLVNIEVSNVQLGLNFM
ncbi:MAG: phage N-6-adenine-methyltransferase [Prevotella sp.]|jgi:phage N-6-adenine-methyltransferase|nr:phage N-6-adenine-methyltransferase [Prevotella sp.]